MADNVTADAGSGGAVFRTDDDGTAHWPYTKMAWGADNTQTIVTTSAGIPVQLYDGAGNALAHLEDAAHTTGDAGVQVLAVRNDTLAALAGTDGDYAPIQVNASGAVYTVVTGTATVDNGGTFAVQVDGDALTALQLIDNVVYTHDAAGGTAVGNMAMAQRDDEVGSTATTSADGDAAALTVNKFSQLKTTEIADQTSEIKYAAIDAATSGNNTLVAAAGAGVKIRVLSVFAVAAGDVLARFEDGAGGTALTGQMDLTTNSGFVLPYNPGGWFETSDNTLLNLELDGAISVDGCLSYVEV